MKKSLISISMISLFTLIVFHLATVYGNKDKIRVLFIGNSLTSANKLPRMVSDIAESHGFRLIYDSHTPGGARLANHATSPRVLDKIKGGSWDFVVFQEQSQYPGFSIKQLSRDVFPYARHLSDAVKKANSHSSVVFYMTMARRNGDPDNQNVSPELLTYAGMQKRVNRCYLELGKRNEALIAPVGAVWSAAREEEPELVLYADNVHPNKTGSYLAACVFYSTLFGRASTGSHVPEGVDRDSAQYIQGIVDRIVLDGDQEWDWRR